MAAAEPGSLVLGVDPVADRMAESSRRARKAAPNALFVAASAEAFALELPAVADRVVLNFPWAALLLGVLGSDPVVGCAIAAIPRNGGRVDALVSVTARDGIPGVEALDARVAASLRPAPRLDLVSACPASREEVIATRSTWGRRLLGGGEPRPVWRLVWRSR